ncbi:MAG TPA: hypothetical protein VK988_08160 [Acidimicrobiales bacterium]|nr:hypothetical protein [Acidimicrobiales bacterium]
MTEIHQFEPQTASLSGRYVYNGGVEERHAGFVDARMRPYTRAELQDPVYDLRSPVYTEPKATGRQGLVPDAPAFTLHIDVDGTDPLGVVSGDVVGDVTPVGAPTHFIGRVIESKLDGAARTLAVGEFRFAWPGTGELVDRVEISLSPGAGTPSADVTFVAIGGTRRHGPYTVNRESAYFRQVEVEVDVEDGAVRTEPYVTTTHPVRPAGLPGETLTLESTFAKAGISILRSPDGDTIDSSSAGADARWDNAELHDAMESHWSTYANKPQWKMWVFVARLGESDTLGGIMFDAEIQEPGGVDRQGTALFTLCPHFHTAGGEYPQSNPPAREAAQRELFFNLIHETGHAFNLAHSFQKQNGNPWGAPPWMPLEDVPQALSWMNYPDQAAPGQGAAAVWFYERFRFRFDDAENLYLRHAPSSLVEMGNETWFENHGRVAIGTVDPRLEFTVRSLTDTFEFGEPVFVELKLKNRGDTPVMVHRSLYPSEGLVELAITNPRRQRLPWLPIAHTRSALETEVLAPGQAIYRELNMTMGKLGFPFKEPGPYRLEASYRNTDGATAGAVMQLHVRPPADYEVHRAVSTLFDARVGRVLQVGGSRLMEDANEKIDTVNDRVGEAHPATFYLDAVRAMPLAKPYKVLRGDAGQVEVEEQDPDIVQQRLTPLVEQPSKAADVVGHIVYRRLVETYTDAALETRNRSQARQAQSRMLELFRSRGVIQPVVEEVEQRVDQLR